jgi:hypothetical protein
MHEEAVNIEYLVDVFETNQLDPSLTGLRKLFINNFQQPEGRRWEWT